MKLRQAGLIAGMIIAWSVYYTVSKLTVDATGSAYLTGFLLRSAALVFLSAQLLADKGFRRLFRQGKAVWLLLLIGLFGFLLDLFANLGYAGGSLGTGTVLLKTDVLMVNLVTVAMLHRKLYLSDWLGTVVMLLGVVLVLGIDFSGIQFHVTDLFFLASAACVTANAFLIRRVQMRHGCDTDTISYYNNFVVLLLFAVFTLSRGELQLLGTGRDFSFWLLVALGGLAQAGIYFFYYRNLRQTEVWIVKLWLLLMPLLSCLIGVVFLGETLTVWKIVGGAVVLLGAGLILARNRLHGKKQTEEDPS